MPCLASAARIFDAMTAYFCTVIFFSDVWELVFAGGLLRGVDFCVQAFPG